MDESRFRTISAREFARRFRGGVARGDKTYVKLLGAGCSVSSGVPAAAEIVKLWLKELIYFESGDETDLDAWAARRFARYDPNDPASIYGEAFQALFHNERDKRQELERLMEAAEPGFGYATLAQLMTHPKWGPRINLAITVNFDDMLGDALHVFSQRRPQILTHLSLTETMPLPPDAPTVVKVFGDAHMGADEGGVTRARLPHAVKARLRDRLTDSCLAIIGYGGRDASVLDLLEGLPPTAPTGGVYWINSAPPKGAFADWLQSRRAIWVKSDDFDELFYFCRLEFGIGHPTLDRFERVFRKYNAKYRELSTRSGLTLPSTAPSETPSVGSALDDRAGGVIQFPKGGQAARRETAASRRDRLRRSLHAYSRAISDTASLGEQLEERQAAGPMRGMISAAQFELHGDPESHPGDGGLETGVDPVAPRPLAPYGQRAQAQDAAATDVDGSGAATAQDEFAKLRPGERRALPAATRMTDTLAEDASDSIDNVLAALENESEISIPRPTRESRERRRAQLVSRSARQALVDRTAERAPRRADPGEGLRRLGRNFSVRRRARPSGQGPTGLPVDPRTLLQPDRASAGDLALAAAIEANPDDGVLRARYARFMAVGAGDVGRAEVLYEEALQLAPENLGVLREYARFSLDRLRDAKRAEHLLVAALKVDVRNAETLRAMADFFLRARGDLGEAEDCFRLAIEIAPESTACLIDYAWFLADRRGELESAEAYLRKAIDASAGSAVAFAELALFLIERRRSVDAAEAVLVEGARIGPDDPEIQFARAVASERKGDLDAAEAYYRRAAGLEPRDARIQIAFSNFLAERRGDLDAAEAQFEDGLRATPSSAALATAYAQFLTSCRKDRKRADELHRRAIEAEPYAPVSLAAYAEHLASEPTMADEADALFRDALAFSPRSSAALRAHGRFLAYVKGDSDEALAQLRLAVELDPCAEALEELAMFHHRIRKDVEEAELFFRDAVEASDNRAGTLERFAAFLREAKGDAESVAQEFERAVEKSPRDAPTLLRAARFLLAEGKRADGLKVLNNAFDAAWRVDSSNRPGPLMLELWICRYAHDQKRRDDSWRSACGLIANNVRCDGAELHAMAEMAVTAGHPEPDRLRDLVSVAVDGADPARLG
ncbi:MAG: hypothetical protein MRY74_12070 [Neomegalonema sp.]|nr:hypothetical protein [Neomegalonema sp.]